jgi:hypothetical protein
MEKEIIKKEKQEDLIKKTQEKLDKAFEKKSVGVMLDYDAIFKALER